jgi:hypothetical protein
MLTQDTMMPQPPRVTSVDCNKKNSTPNAKVQKTPNLAFSAATPEIPQTYKSNHVVVTGSGFDDITSLAEIQIVYTGLFILPIYHRVVSAQRLIVWFIAGDSQFTGDEPEPPAMGPDEEAAEKCPPPHNVTGRLTITITTTGGSASGSQEIDAQ